MDVPSIRTAALAFALSSWVEGLTQLRTALLIPYAQRGIPADQQDEADFSSPIRTTWISHTVSWLKRKGREMDETERTSLAAVDISTAFFILQTLRQPMLPFLLSPLLTTLPLPRSTNSFKPIKWPYLFLATLVLSLAHETERVTVSLVVECVRQSRDARIRKLLGEVYVCGGEHHPRVEGGGEDEHEECLICAGVGADTSLSQSISSISSIATAPQTNALGPLEAFCTTAPQKHVAHRSCFLSWHAAYRQQRIHLPPELVELRDCMCKGDKTHAASILDAAGFGHLSEHLRLTHEAPWLSVSPSLSHSTLTLTDDTMVPSPQASRDSKFLATLRTSIPPCPGCRSSVLLHFFSRPALFRDTQQRTWIRRAKYYFCIWLRLWRELVTGRTILYRLASQWSVVMAMFSMMRVSRRKVQWTYV